MSKWSQFRYNEQEIPETHYEACVFLSHARQHLLNRLGGPLRDDHDIIIRAWQAINDEIWPEVAA
jgi:hypothetical protein